MLSVVFKQHKNFILEPIYTFFIFPTFDLIFWLMGVCTFIELCMCMLLDAVNIWFVYTDPVVEDANIDNEQPGDNPKKEQSKKVYTFHPLLIYTVGLRFLSSTSA